jgi:hypothetical protein
MFVVTRPGFADTVGSTVHAKKLLEGVELQKGVAEKSVPPQAVKRVGMLLAWIPSSVSSDCEGRNQSWKAPSL